MSGPTKSIMDAGGPRSPARAQPTRNPTAVASARALVVPRDRTLESGPEGRDLQTLKTVLPAGIVPANEHCVTSNVNRRCFQTGPPRFPQVGIPARPERRPIPGQRRDRRQVVRGVEDGIDRGAESGDGCVGDRRSWASDRYLDRELRRVARGEVSRYDSRWSKPTGGPGDPGDIHFQDQ